MKGVHVVFCTLILLCFLVLSLIPAAPAARAATFTVAKPFGPSDTAMDPAKGSNGWYASQAGVTETLFALDFDMTLMPWLAKGFTNLTPLTWEIRLRQDVQFHSHRPMTATAVKASLERLIDEKSPHFNRRAQGLLDLKSITVKDTYTLVMETRHPAAAFVYNLASPEAGIIDADQKKLSGTGPFCLEKVVPNQTTMVRAFSEYWGKTPKLDRAELFVIKNPVSRMLAFESGKIDAALGFPELDAVRLMEKGAQIQSLPTARLCFFFVRTQDGPLADARLRKAINLAIDRQQIVKTVLGGIGGTPGASIFPALLPWCNPDLTPYPCDPDKAAALLAQAGAKDTDGDGILELAGAPLRLNMWTYEARASLKPTLELIQTQLLKVGIDSKIRVTKKGSPINQAMRQGKVQLNLQMWNAAPQGDPDAFISDILLSNARSNFMGYANPELDRLAQEARTCFDPEKRKALYNRIQAIIYEESPLIVLFHKSMVSALSDRVQGYRLHPAEKYLLTPEIVCRPHD